MSFGGCAISPGQEINQAPPDMKWNATLFLLMVAVSLKAQSSIQGGIKLAYLETKGHVTDTSNAYKKEFGNAITATTEWYACDFFGRESVSAGVWVKNTGTKPMFFNYYVAFFDKDKNLVGAVTQGSFGKNGMKPGENTYLGSCQICLPKDKYKSIVSYQAVIYETDLPPEEN